MSSSNYKIKGHQKPRTPKPYDRPGLVGRVKEWLSPSSWTNYFRKDTASSTSQEIPSTLLQSHALGRQSHDQAMISQQSHDQAMTSQQSHDQAMTSQQWHYQAMTSQQSHDQAMISQQSRDQAVISQQSRDQAVISQQSHDQAMTSQQSHDLAVLAHEQVPPVDHPVPVQLRQRPQKSEATVSEAELVCEDNSVRAADHTPVEQTRPVNNPLVPNRRQFALSHSSNKPRLGPDHNHIGNRLRVQLSETDNSHYSGDSGASWIAEAGSDNLEMAVGDVSSGSNESWIAEAEEQSVLPVGGTTRSLSRPAEKPSTTKPLSRPVSILLAQKELALISDDTPTSSPQSCIVGEGRAGIVNESTFLVTPGAEMTVRCIANPSYNSGHTHITFSQTGSSPYPRTSTNKPVMTRTSTNKPVMTSTTIKGGGSKMYTASRGSATTLPVSFAPSGPAQEQQLGVTSVQGAPTSRAVHCHLISHAVPTDSYQLPIREDTVAASLPPPAPNTPFFTRHRSDYTSESIKRSPFRSPFYSGRTAYGGAASGQKVRVKRPRLETSPPPAVLKQVTVRPSHPPHHASTNISNTTKRILDSLQVSNSPLSDARKMPMRQHLPGEDRPTKRRRVSPSVLSPPPVTPLHPSSQLGHRQVPPLKDFHVTSDTQMTPPTKSATTQSEYLILPPRTAPTTGVTPPSAATSSIPGWPNTSMSSPPLGLQKTTVNFSTSATASKQTKQSAVLSGLKFTPAPVHQVAKSKPRSDRDSSPVQGGQGSSPPMGVASSRHEAMGKRAGGKLRSTKKSYQHFSRKSSRDEEEEVDSFVNPLAPPPPVGLTLNTGKTLASIKFHTQFSPKSTALSTATTSSLISSTVSPSPQNFSFAAPKTVTTRDSWQPHQAPTPFGFTVPKPLPSLSSGTTTSSTLSVAVSKGTIAPPSSRDSDSISKPMPMLVKLRPKEPKQPLPLKAGSVEEFFKVQAAPVSGKDLKPSTKSSSAGDVIDLTADTSSKQSAPLKPLQQFAPPPGAWTCDVCCVSNKPDLDQCVACQSPRAEQSSRAEQSTIAKPPPTMTSAKPLPTLAPPSGSWECGECFVTNKQGDDKCVCCSNPKPGSSKAEGKAKLTAVAAAPLSMPSPPTGTWSCDACFVENKAEDTSCVCCTAPRPGTTATSSSSGGTTTGGLGSGGLKLGESGGIELGDAGGIKLGAGGLKLGAGLKLGVGLKLGGESGGLKLGTGGSGELKLGGESGGLKLDTGESGGLKLGDESGELKIGHGGLKLGAPGGQKLGEGGLKLGEGGLKLGEGGLKLGEGGLKLGEGGLKLGEGGLKLGEGGLKLGEGGLKLGGGGLNLGGSTGLKLGGSAGGLKFGGGLSSANEKPTTCKPESNSIQTTTEAGGIKFGSGFGPQVSTGIKIGSGLLAVANGSGGVQDRQSVGEDNKLAKPIGSVQLGSKLFGSLQKTEASGGLKLGSLQATSMFTSMTALHTQAQTAVSSSLTMAAPLGTSQTQPTSSSGGGIKFNLGGATQVSSTSNPLAAAAPFVFSAGKSDAPSVSSAVKFSLPPGSQPFSSATQNFSGASSSIFQGALGGGTSSAPHTNISLGMGGLGSSGSTPQAGTSLGGGLGSGNIPQGGLGGGLGMPPQTTGGIQTSQLLFGNTTSTATTNPPLFQFSAATKSSTMTTTNPSFGVSVAGVSTASPAIVKLAANGPPAGLQVAGTTPASGFSLQASSVVAGSNPQGTLGSSFKPVLQQPFQFQAGTQPPPNTSTTPSLTFGTFNFSAAAGGQGSSGTSSSGAGNAQPPAPFQFGTSAPPGPGPSSGQGFKFNMQTPASFNFTPQNTNTDVPNFTGTNLSGNMASEDIINKRVIRKAARRKR